MVKEIFDEINRNNFEQNGITVIENFLTEKETEELYQAGRKLCLEAPKEGRTVFSTIQSSSAQNREKYFIESNDKVRYFYESGALDENGELLVDPMVALNKIGHALHTEIETFRQITFSDRIKEICRNLGYKRPAIPQSMYIFKNPGIGGEVIPHQDSTYLYTEPMTTLGIWIPLEDATPINGCLQAIKGSHKNTVHRRYVRNPDKKSTELLIHDKPIVTYCESDFVQIPVAKGSCVLIHGQVVHKSDHNRSEKSRHAYTFHIVETHQCKYSEDNWLQPPEGKEFPILYEEKN